MSPFRVYTPPLSFSFPLSSSAHVTLQGLHPTACLPAGRLSSSFPLSSFPPRMLHLPQKNVDIFRCHYGAVMGQWHGICALLGSINHYAPCQFFIGTYILLWFAFVTYAEFPASKKRAIFAQKLLHNSLIVNKSAPENIFLKSAQFPNNTQNVMCNAKRSRQKTNRH
jgi:hypothetical protein